MAKANAGQAQQPRQPAAKKVLHKDHPDAFLAEVVSSSAPHSKVRIRVRATRDGFYDEKYYRAGDVLDVHPDHFADAATVQNGWMVKVPRRVQPRITSSGEALKRDREQITGHEMTTLSEHTQEGLEEADEEIEDPLGAGEGGE